MYLDAAGNKLKFVMPRILVLSAYNNGIVEELCDRENKIAYNNGIVKLSEEFCNRENRSHSWRVRPRSPMNHHL